MKINRPPSPEFRRALAIAYETKRLPEGHPKRAPQPKCDGKPELYVDYDEPPSKEGQQRLCADCPLFALCGKSAAYSRPSWGIHAGNAWDMGRRYREDEESSEDFLDNA